MTLAIIFANGVLEGLVELPRLEDMDLVIAADGGLRHALGLGVNPQVVIGDLDSAPNELLQIAQRNGAEVIRHPAEKDKTDLELALDLARERGADEIVVVAARGGRVDHELANVLLLAGPRATAGIRMVGAASGTEVRGSSGRAYEMQVVTRSAEIHGAPGDIVSLLALGTTVTGVMTTGLQYPLEDGTLELGSSRGVSNLMTAETASVAVGQGLLLVIHIPL